MFDKNFLQKTIYTLIYLSLLAFFVIFILPAALIVGIGFLIALTIFIVILRLKLKKKGIKVDVSYTNYEQKDSAKKMKDVTFSNKEIDDLDQR